MLAPAGALLMAPTLSHLAIYDRNPNNGKECCVAGLFANYAAAFLGCRAPRRPARTRPSVAAIRLSAIPAPADSGRRAGP